MVSNTDFQNYYENFDKHEKLCTKEGLNEQKLVEKLQQSCTTYQTSEEKKKIQEQQLKIALTNLEDQQNQSHEICDQNKQSRSSDQNSKMQQDQYQCLTKAKSQQVQIQLSMKTMGLKQCEGKRKKNFLPIIKRCIIRLYYHQLSLIKDEKITNFIEQKAKTNRRQFQHLFRNEEARQFLADLFTDKKLQRQIQLTRIDGENRKLFLCQINKLRLCFCSKRICFE